MQLEQAGEKNESKASKPAISSPHRTKRKGKLFIKQNKA